MQIELPQDGDDKEHQAIQEGINAWRAGDVQEFDEFDREFRVKNGISTQDALKSEDLE